jgi:hypothetical protein
MSDFKILNMSPLNFCEHIRTGIVPQRLLIQEVQVL